MDRNDPDPRDQLLREMSQQLAEMRSELADLKSQKPAADTREVVVTRELKPYERGWKAYLKDLLLG